MSGPSHGTSEMHSARSKLSETLQTLVEKPTESPVKEEQKDDFDAMDDTGPSTPSKRSKHGKHGRKRKRHEQQEEQQEQGQYHHTYVMKLFDRSVDLAQFDEQTPLYPVCRAWMKNQPHNRSLGVRARSPTPQPDLDSSDDDDLEDEDRPVYRLPSPVAVKTERGYVNTDMRVPSPLPFAETEHTLDEINENPALQPLPETLLLNHMVRWKDVRAKWKKASRENEARYAPSLNMLKDMYDRSCKDQ